MSQANVAQLRLGRHPRRGNAEDRPAGPAGQAQTSELVMLAAAAHLPSGRHTRCRHPQLLR